MASPIRPQYFCTRPNGVVTPLIAVDELPSQISIRGAPRTLQPDQMQGMTSLGTVAPRSPQNYVVDTAASTSPRPRAPFTPRRAQDPDQQALLARLLTDEALPESVRLAITTLQEYGLLQSFTLSAPSSSKWMVSSGGGGGGGGAGHGGSRQGPHQNLKKIYCSFWLRHGECDYEQQGCIYKHIMPLDAETLGKLGLRDIPRWFREKHGLPSLLSNGNAQPRPHPELAALPPADSGPLKTIQYPTRPEIEGVPEAPDSEPGIMQQAGDAYSIQQTLALPGPLRPAYESRRARSSQRHGVTHAPSLRRLDLLSLDARPDFPGYSSVGSASGNMGVLSYPPPQETAAFADQSHQRTEFFRNVQALMPGSMAENSDYLMASPPFRSPQSQGFSRTSRKSRRLYQARPNAGLEASDTDAFGGVHIGYGTGPSSNPSPCPMAAPGSLLASPLIGPVLGHTSEPPTRDHSPFTQSGPVSTESSPDLMRARMDPVEARPSFGAIGTKRDDRQQSIGSGPALPEPRLPFS